VGGTFALINDLFILQRLLRSIPRGACGDTGPQLQVAGEKRLIYFTDRMNYPPLPVHARRGRKRRGAFNRVEGHVDRGRRMESRDDQSARPASVVG